MPELLARVPGRAACRATGRGNVRELQNYIERVMAMNPGRILRPSPLPAGPGVSAARPSRIMSSRKLNEVVADTERRILVEALQKAHGKPERGCPSRSA